MMISEEKNLKEYLLNSIAVCRKELDTLHRELQLAPFEVRYRFSLLGSCWQQSSAAWPLPRCLGEAQARRLLKATLSGARWSRRLYGFLLVGHGQTLARGAGDLQRLIWCCCICTFLGNVLFRARACMPGHCLRSLKYVS